MRRRLLLTLGLCAAAVPALAFTVRYVPVPERLAEAEVAVLGKVTIREKSHVTSRVDQHRLTIVHVQVQEDLLGTAGAPTLRVAFIHPRQYLPWMTPVLIPGQKVCLFLSREPGQTFYRIQEVYGAAGDPPTLTAAMDEYEKTVVAARRAAPLLRNPEAGLTSRNPEDRMLTAWMLAVRYRRAWLLDQGQAFEERPLEPWESRRLLQNLMLLADKEPEALWTLFQDLGLEPWKMGFQPEEFAPNAKKWLREHAVTWRFRQRVAKTNGP